MTTASIRISVPLAIGGILVLTTAAACRATGAEPPTTGRGAPSGIEIAGPGEPGTRLVVTGQVFRPDGVTPAAGVTLYVYQTDATGLYAPTGTIPRLRGWMTTDEQGRYEYRTIRPAPYPSQPVPAHVHTQLWGGGAETQWNEELEFSDDPLLSDRSRRASAAAGRFGGVCTPRIDPDGTQRCTHDLRLKPDSDEFQGGTRHGFVPK
jgi:protocatechuate 3,4-dioxygenase beta subunit